MQLQPPSTAAAGSRHRDAADADDDDGCKIEAPAAGTRQHGRRHLASLRTDLFSRETAAADVQGCGDGGQATGDGGRSACTGRQAATDALVDGERTTSVGDDDDDDGGTREAVFGVDNIACRNDTDRLASPSAK